jgi:hypothetical protein
MSNEAQTRTRREGKDLVSDPRRVPRALCTEQLATPAARL